MSEGLKLLRSILEHGSTEKLHEIDGDLFVVGAETEAFQFTLQHYAEHRVLPEYQTVEDELDIRIPRAPEPVDFYLERCLDRELFSNVRPEFTGLNEAMRAKDMEAVRRHCELLGNVGRDTSRTPDIMTSTAMSEDAEQAYLRRELSGDMAGLPTGWHSVDVETLGWQGGDLIVIVARPGIGKTNLLIHSARHAWKSGKSVMFASMEMAARQITFRLAAQIAGINPTAVRKGTLCYWTRQRLREAFADMKRDNRFTLYAGEFKGKSAQHLAKTVNDHSPDGVYIDGLYLMKSDIAPKQVGRYEKVAYVTDELKSLALVTNRPIVATTQFGRGAGKGGRSGDLENIGYTDALSTHASIIIGLRIPADQRGARYPATRVLDFLKGREGETGSILVNHTFTPLSFEEKQETGAARAARMVREEEEEEGARRDSGAYQQQGRNRLGPRDQAPGATTDFMNNGRA